jgi:hypothetical protein
LVNESLENPRVAVWLKVMLPPTPRLKSG